METSPCSAIGIFDSGVGGLSVWKEIHKNLPHIPLVYVADSLYCPYGPRSTDEIKKLTTRIVEGLLTYHQCQLIVVACNTITSATIEFLRQNYPVPFVGMEPAIKPAALATKTKKVGVLATEATLRGEMFHKLAERYGQDVTFYTQAGHGLVELVEQGEEQSTKARRLLEQYLKPMLNQGVDNVVLGCTHYPFLLPLIEEIVGPEVKIHDPAPAVARRVCNLLNIPLQQQPMTQQQASGDEKISTASRIFYSSGNIHQLVKLVEKITGRSCTAINSPWHGFTACSLVS